MGRPQEQELQRSGNTPLDPDHVAAQAAHHPPAPHDEPHRGPVPPDNRAGHHPDHEQDQPDLDEFAEALGVTDRSEQATTEDGVPAPVRSAASTARELAEPVAHAVQTTIARATRTIDEWRHLAERVERLESEIAELRRQVESQQR